MTYVVSPQGSDLILTSDIPNGEVDVLVLDSLDVEADGGDGGDDLTELELVEDGGLTSGHQRIQQRLFRGLQGEIVAVGGAFVAARLAYKGTGDDSAHAVFAG